MPFGTCLAVTGANAAGAGKISVRFSATLYDGSNQVVTELTTAGFDPSVAGAYRTAITDALVAGYAAAFNNGILPRGNTGVPTYQAGL